MSTLTAEQAIERIYKAVASPEVRDARSIQIGQVMHQGDVYLHWMPLDWPRGKLLGTKQIAVGDTIGSRHIVVGGGFEVYEGVQMPEWVTFDRLPQELRERLLDSKALLGPVVVLTAPLETGEGLTHPEHAHHLMPCGVAQVTYQLDGMTLAAVRD
jgi:hypothetical protein